jgi:hypothetical protein
MTSVDRVFAALPEGCANAVMTAVDFVAVLVEAVARKRAPHLQSSLRPSGLAGTRLTRPHCGHVVVCMNGYPKMRAMVKSEILERKSVWYGFQEQRARAAGASLECGAENLVSSPFFCRNLFDV